jgi:hypothetical protein
MFSAEYILIIYLIIRRNRHQQTERKNFSTIATFLFPGLTTVSGNFSLSLSPSLEAAVNMNSYYDEYLNIFVDTECAACAVFVMAHPLISCIVYGTQNDNYHNQL